MASDCHLAVHPSTQYPAFSGMPVGGLCVWYNLPFINIAGQIVVFLFVTITPSYGDHNTWACQDTVSVRTGRENRTHLNRLSFDSLGLQSSKGRHINDFT